MEGYRELRIGLIVYWSLQEVSDLIEYNLICILPFYLFHFQICGVQ